MGLKIQNLAQLSEITEFDTKARLISTQLNKNRIEVILALPRQQHVVEGSQLLIFHSKYFRLDGTRTSESK